MDIEYLLNYLDELTVLMNRVSKLDKNAKKMTPAQYQTAKRYIELAGYYITDDPIFRVRYWNTLENFKIYGR